MTCWIFPNQRSKQFWKNIFQKQFNLTPWNKDKDLDNQIDALNNLNPEKMETKSKSNLFNMEQTELSKLNND